MKHTVWLKVVTALYFRVLFSATLLYNLFMTSAAEGFIKIEFAPKRTRCKQAQRLELKNWSANEPPV